MENNVNETSQEEQKAEGSSEASGMNELTAEHETEANQDELHPEEDFSSYGKNELLQKMEEAAGSPDPEHVKGTVNKLKEVFRELVREEMEAKRRAWETSKEDEHDVFMPAPDAVAEKFEELLKKYNQKRSELRRQKENEQRKNLALKLQLIDDLKELAESSESMHKAFERLQELQEKWRQIGPVPQANVSELRQNYQHHLDRFYDMVKISRELRELDHKKNQELKNELIAKAEALKDEPSVRRALSQLHELHEQWREIGPAPKEVNDSLWDTFKAASDKVHDRKQALLEDNKVKQVENLALKTELCVMMDAEAEKTYDSHKAWQDANEKVEALFAEWRKIGHVPKEDEGKAWKRFREARQKFFRSREMFYAKQRDEFKKNLDAKIALCEKAEALKESKDWKNTALQFRRLQDEWKKIGPVPRKLSDKTWQRFKAAADAFFEGRNKQFAEADAAMKENVTVRETLIAEAAATVLDGDLKVSRDIIASFQKKWGEMPQVPRSETERLGRSWKEAMDKLFVQLKEKGGDENMVQRMRYDQLKQTEKGRDQIYRERMAIQDKIKKLQNEINTLETNLGFFSKSKGGQSLVADYQAKVDSAREEVVRLKAQLKMIPRE
ncbi:MAG TPA: DUF349 domain-containing protein [Bacteroidia bacterium]|nr:DUF349 domain-containing protein [Bacteroidia bacterium]